MPASPTPILYVHYGSGGIRGSERVLLDLLAHANHERIAPILWCNGAEMAAAAEALGVPVVHRPFSILLGWQPPRWDVGQYRRLVREGLRLIREHRVRLVHVNSGAPVQWMLPAARTAHVPIVAHLHAAYVPRDRLTLGLHQVALVAGVSRPVIEGLLADGMPAGRVTVVPNSVDIDRLGAGSAAGLRAGLGIPDATPVVTAVGAVIHSKGFDILLQAAATLRRSGVTAHYLLVGDGPERATLETLTADLGLGDIVHWLGERRDAGAILRDATTIAVSATRDEAFGLTLVEAGAFGLPVVAPRVGGVSEVVINGETGILVPPDDPARLAEALARLIADPALAARLGAAARSRVRAQYMIGRMVTTFDDLYSRLIAADPATYGWRAGWTPTPGLWRRAWRAAARRVGVRSATE